MKKKPAKRGYSRKPEGQVKIAKERIAELFKQADEVFKEDPKLSNRYVVLARKISMKFKVRISPILKKKFCKHCYSFLKVGSNCRVRTHEGKVVYSCMNCKKFMRFPYKGKKPKK